MKNIIKIVTFLSIIISLFYLSLFISRINTNKIVINTIPVDAKIMINGKSTNNIIYSKNGDILISVYKEGYYEDRQIYLVDKNNTELSIILNEKSPKTIGELLNSTDYQTVFNKYSIIKHIPYENILFKINYTYDSTLEDLVIEIETSDGYRETALYMIKSWDINPADYNIIFKNYKNPFKL